MNKRIISNLDKTTQNVDKTTQRADKFTENIENGDKVTQNSPLFIIEAMKMESTITASKAGTVKAILLTEKTMVQQDDLVIEME